MARTPPPLDYGSTSESGPVSPISRDSSVDVGPRGRAGYGERPRRVSNPKILGMNGLVMSPTSNHSMDQMIWELGHSREQTSGSDGSNESNESEVKRGKKRASIDSTTLGYHQSVGMDMIGMARGSGMNQFAELHGSEISELAA